MTLVQAWIDSIQLLRPKNFKLFVMVTLKSVVEAYKLLFKYFWWLIAFQLMCLFPSFLGIGSFFIAMILYQLLFFIVCVIARPSVVKKDLTYFRSQLYSFIYFIPLLLVNSTVESVFAPIGKFLPFSAWTILSILFFLDSEKNVKNLCLSAWHALKMIIFNFPFILCVHIAIWLFTAVIFSIISLPVMGTMVFGMSISLPLESFFFAALVYGVIVILLLPISVCTYANIYIKKLYDQSDLYADQLE